MKAHKGWFQNPPLACVCLRCTFQTDSKQEPSLAGALRIDMAAPFITVLLKRCSASWSRLSKFRRFKALNFSTTQDKSQKANGSENYDFYRYTSGRWLWNEGSRLQERFKPFNIQGLKSLAAKACGAQSCVSIFKLAEGGFNRVFRLIMENGAVVVARIPTPIVGPISKVLASEVATMDFVSMDLNL